jgi:aspartate carbamoyltransferase catalytic subunit
VEMGVAVRMACLDVLAQNHAAFLDAKPNDPKAGTGLK